MSSGVTEVTEKAVKIIWGKSMSSGVTEVTEKAVKIYTISEAARRLGTTYNRIKYAIANRWIVLYSSDPDLIEENELFNFAKSRGIEIPQE